MSKETYFALNNDKIDNLVEKVVEAMQTKHLSSFGSRTNENIVYDAASGLVNQMTFFEILCFLCKGNEEKYTELFQTKWEIIELVEKEFEKRLYGSSDENEDDVAVA